MEYEFAVNIEYHPKPIPAKRLMINDSSKIYEGTSLGDIYSKSYGLKGSKWIASGKIKKVSRKMLN